MTSRDTNQGWTVVRYGKRRQLPQPSRDSQYYSNNRPRQDNRTYAEVAATPLPPKRRTYHKDFTKQDRQPINRHSRRQPPGDYEQHTQYNRLHARPPIFYKQQIGYNNKSQHNTQPNNNKSQHKTQLNTDLETTENIDIMYKVITMVHHLHNVYHQDALVEPPTITRLTDYLTDIIKPAAPNQSTLQFIQGNAKNWAHTTLLILKQHYSDTLEIELDKLVTKKPSEWDDQFEFAVQRARRLRGRRLKEETISRAKDLISAYFAALSDETDSQGSASESAQLPADTPATKTNPNPQEAAQRKSKSYKTVAIQTDKISNDWSPITSKGTSTPQTHIEAVSNLITLDEDQIEGSSTIATPSLSLTSPLPPRAPRERNTIPSPLDGSPILKPMEKEKDDGRLSPVIGLLPTTKTHQTHFTPPQTLHIHNKTPQPTHTSHDNHGIQNNTSQNLTPQPHSASNNKSTLGHTLSTSPKRVTVHPKTANKNKHWDLKIWQSNLIIGDSNVGRIGPFHNQDVQIDCYPGANFLHAETLLLKAKTHCQVNNIVLSFGMNSRTAKVKETTIKQIQRALKAAKDKFPHAHIWIPRINFSGCLPTALQTNLQAINTYIARNYQTIPLLPSNEFQTIGDGVHWTPETANNMLKHWLNFLN